MKQCSFTALAHTCTPRLFKQTQFSFSMPKIKSSPRGPKYTRYFYAYSDRTFIHKLLAPTTFLLTLTDQFPFGTIPLKTHILRVELPLTTGDVGARYGALIIPKTHLADFYRQGPAFQEKRLAPRILDSADSELSYLVDLDFTPKDPSSTGMNLGEAHQLTYPESQIIPYRAPISHTDLEALLEQRGYSCVQHFPYGLFASQRKEVLGIEQNPHLHFHCIPQVERSDELKRLNLPKLLPAAGNN